MENLFKRIFVVNPEKRITFFEIRSHPVFRNYFADENNEYLEAIYKSKIKMKDNICVASGNTKENIEN